MYMQVESHSGTLLHLKRNPSIRSWSLLVGISSVGLAAAFYSTDTWAWKLFYVAGCVFVALQNLEDWEEAIFDKKSGKATLKTYNLYRKLLTLCQGGQEQVVVLLKEIRDANVEEEKVQCNSPSPIIEETGTDRSGAKMPLRQDVCAVVCRDVEAVNKLLTSFLELDLVENQSQTLEESSDSEVSLDEE